VTSGPGFRPASCSGPGTDRSELPARPFPYLRADRYVRRGRAALPAIGSPRTAFPLRVRRRILRALFGVMLPIAAAGKTLSLSGEKAI
jgi:hypothetical protein